MTPISQTKPSSPVTLFFASITWDSFTKADTNSLVTIQYLRTYLNAGRAKVYLCGHKNEPFGTIDSLWEYPLRHISIPEFFSYYRCYIHTLLLMAYLQGSMTTCAVYPTCEINSCVYIDNIFIVIIIIDYLFNYYTIILYLLFNYFFHRVLEDVNI